MIGMYPVGFFNNELQRHKIEYILSSNYDLFLPESGSFTWVNNSLYPSRISRWNAMMPSTNYLARPSGFSTDDAAPYFNSENVFFDGYIDNGFTPENQIQRLGYLDYDQPTVFCVIVWDTPRAGPIVCLSGLSLSLDQSPTTSKGRVRLSSGTETVYLENEGVDTGKQCTCFWYNNATKTVSMTTNGGSVASATVADAAISSTMVILAHDNESIGNSQLFVYGLATGTSIPTNEDRQKIEGYFCHRFSLSEELPEGHPYKNSPPL